MEKRESGFLGRRVGINRAEERHRGKGASWFVNPPSGEAQSLKDRKKTQKKLAQREGGLGERVSLIPDRETYFKAKPQDTTPEKIRAQT